jgi:DNA-binding FadR family transcriptional regulator
MSKSTNGSKRLYVGVLNKLIRLIDAGEYPVGGRLPPERELAERFKVSRPTIREAIIALEALGRVQVKTGSGIYVLEHGMPMKSTLDGISPFELTESRALIEGEAAALAANLITDEELEQLEQSLYDMATECDEGNLTSGEADRLFHSIIANATRNAMMVSIIEHLWHVRNNAPQVYSAYKKACSVDGESRVEEHKGIYEALKNRDAHAARAAMHEHFARILNQLIATSEAEQVELARKKAQEVRQRYSLDHLSSIN